MDRDQQLRNLNEVARIARRGGGNCTVRDDRDRYYLCILGPAGVTRAIAATDAASLLDSARGHNNAAVEKLKGYMRDLAAQVEDQMEIAHEEAQRCRSNLLTKPRGRN